MDDSSSTMLPEPTLTFTLPSLHDGVPLDCRVYHPLSLAASPRAPAWQKHTAIIAHPYAPLGGCYDDPVVGILAGTLLRLGFLVGTFNFRGAHGSAGRTSWTAKAETADYMSFVGFVTHYVHFLDPFHTIPHEPAFRDHDGGTERERVGPSPEPSSPVRLYAPPNHDIPVLLLGGYSYGAMITTNLPSLESILGPFTTPARETPAAEIRQRAQHLAEMQNTTLGSARAAAIERQNGKALRKSLGLRIGGDEDNRKSHDSRRSFSLDLEDRIHKSMAELRTKARLGHKKRVLSEGISTLRIDEPEAPPEGQPKQTHPECLIPILGRTSYRPAYLLISPLQGVVINLATMSFPSPLASLSRRVPVRSLSWSSNRNSPSERKEENLSGDASLCEAELKLTSHPTLAIYGDRDAFVAARRLREWASRLEAVPNSKFRAHEVSSAGHFWVQGNAASIMRDAVKVFTEAVLEERGV